MKIKVLALSLFMVFSLCSCTFASTGVTTDSLNLRDEYGDLICVIPAGEMVYVDNYYDSSRVNVIWGGLEGNVLSEYIIQDDDFIYVNMDNQRIYLYIDSELICNGHTVTGLAGADRETPKGVFYIQYMDTELQLGNEYYVEYWFSFYGDYGIHDADNWRCDYGGDIYLYDGLHGCVNIPNWLAQIIYDYSYIGMPVIIN